MSRSTAALLITIMFHLLLFLLFNFLISLSPEKVEKKQEHRIKVALKDKLKPTEKKSAEIENTIKPAVVPPMPQGKQLQKQAPTSMPVQRPQKESKHSSEIKKTQEIEKKIEELKKEISKTKNEPEPKIESSKKPAFKHVEKFAKNEDVNVIKKSTEKKTGLYAALSKKQDTNAIEKIDKVKTGTHIGSDFQEAYGEAFGKLSEGEKKYVIDNQEIMRRITQEQLNRLGPVNIPRNLRVNATNIIEFYLHPNGDISGLKIVSASNVNILDDTSLQTIEYSYHRYPLPKQKTLIRYKVGYWLGGREP